MKSYKFWAGLAMVALLCSASFAFGESSHQSQSLATSSSVNLPASLLTFVFAPGGNVSHNFNNTAQNNNGWGGNGGGCPGQGGNGGNGGNGWGGNGGGWGGGGGNGGNGGCSVPEGGNSFSYLLLAALACVGAIAFRMRPQPAVQEVK